jgi:hypothetical protein
MRDFINGMGTMFTIFTVLGFLLAVWVLPKGEIGYSLEYRAELDNKIANLVPLSIADIGLNASDVE